MTMKAQNYQIKFEPGDEPVFKRIENYRKRKGMSRKEFIMRAVGGYYGPLNNVITKWLNNELHPQLSDKSLWSVGDFVQFNDDGVNTVVDKITNIQYLNFGRLTQGAPAITLLFESGRKVTFTP